MTLALSVTRDPVEAVGATLSLVLRLSGEAVALPVANVHEVIDSIPRTRVPRASDFAPWLINVRGTVIPLVDVRRRLRMTVPTTETDRIVVLDLVHDGQAVRLAMLADAVEMVAEFDLAMIETLPDRAAPWPRNYVKGVLRRDGDLVLVLDIDTLFRPDGGTSALT